MVICCCSSFIELIPSFDNTAVAAAEALLSIFGRYGATFYLRSDNAANFAGDVIAAFRALMDISADISSLPTSLFRIAQVLTALSKEKMVTC